MKIVKVMPFFAPATRFGGVVTQAAKVCERLANRGHEVHVVTTDNGVDESMPRAQWLERDGYRVYYAPTTALQRVPPYPAPKMRPALDAVLPGADVCALNVGLTVCSHVAARIARRRGVPFVYNAEGALCPVRLQVKGLRKRLFLALIERRIVRRAAACQAVTQKEREDLLAQGAQRIEVIPNGIEPFVPGDGAAFRARHDLDADARLILYLGRLHAIKGIDRLIHAYRMTAPDDTQLVIAGFDEDGTGARLRGKFGHDARIRFVGHLEPDEKRDALTAADVFALTSDSEGLPNAVLEALAAGLPCLLTEPCNVPEVATAGAGCVVPLDLPAIEAGLTTVLAERDAMAVRARELASSRFDLDAVVTELEALYASLA